MYRFTPPKSVHAQGGGIVELLHVTIIILLMCRCIWLIALSCTISRSISGHSSPNEVLDA